MWLQYVAAAGGAGWAFYEAEPEPPHGGGGGGTGGGGWGARTAIAAQRGSLGDFLSQVEERYVGFIELLRVSHAQSTLWSRTGSLTLGPGSVPFQLSNSNNSNNSRRSTSPEHTKAAAEAALLQPPKQMRMAATATRGPGASLLDGVGLAPPPRESQQAVLLAAKTPPPPQQDQGGVAAPEGLGPWASST